MRSQRGKNRTKGKEEYNAQAPLFAGFLLLALVLIAYGNTFQSPFLFDDFDSIAKNANIRKLWPIGEVVASPPNIRDTTVVGRPVLAYSFALNYAISGLNVWSYHALNLLIHLAAGGLLFGLLRAVAPQISGKVAGLIVAIWLLHPLQTNAVTYLAQRAESMAGMFYLATLYYYVRGCRSTRAVPWFCGSTISFVLGIYTKEYVFTAPLFLLLLNFTLLRNTRHARSRHLYTALLAMLAIALFWQTTQDYRFQEFSERKIYSTWEYLKIQSQAIPHYLWLVIWPTSLVFDYTWSVPQKLMEYLPGVLLLGGMILAGLILLRRAPALSCCLIGFFILLAPTSSFLPLHTVPVAEYRMYLPLASVLVGFALCFEFCQRRHWIPSVSPIACSGVGLTLILLFAVLTFQRNSTFQSALSLWQDTASKQPENARALANLGAAKLEFIRTEEDKRDVVQLLKIALSKNPNEPVALYNLATYEAQRGEIESAESLFLRALALQPRDSEILNNLGNIYRVKGNVAMAETFYLKALSYDASNAEAHYNVAIVLAERRDFRDALDHVQQCLELNSRHPFAPKLKQDLQRHSPE